MRRTNFPSPLARRVANGLLLAAGATGLSEAAAQSRWIHSLTAPAEIEYDSNPSMATNPTAGTTWLRVTPTFTSRYVLDRDEFGLEAGLTAEKSSNTEVAKDRLDPRLRGTWKHLAPLDTTELEVLLDRSALRDVGISQQVPIGVDGARTLFSITGRWTHDLDPLSSVATEVAQEWERFSGTASPDFRRSSATVRYTRARDERTSWYAGLNGQVYRSDATEGFPAVPPAPAIPPVPAIRSTALGALAGVKRELTPTLTVDVNAGPVHFTGPSRTGWQGALAAEYTVRRGLAALELARAPVVNTTSGGLVLEDQMKLRLRYDLGALSHVEAEAGHARERAADTRRSLASVAWVRQWTASWQVAVKASTQRQDGPTGNATSNRLGVVFTYTAPDL